MAAAAAADAPDAADAKEAEEPRSELDLLRDKVDSAIGCDDADQVQEVLVEALQASVNQQALGTSLTLLKSYARKIDAARTQWAVDAGMIDDEEPPKEAPFQHPDFTVGACQAM